MKYLYLVPEEVRTAKLVSDELGEVSRATASNSTYIVWNFCVFLFGCIVGFVGAPYADDNLLNGLIMFDGVVVGFVITAMLFSGRSQYLTKMSHEQTLLYAQKTKYMLMSQINTLFSFLMCLLFSVLSMAAIKTGFMDRAIVFVLCLGYFSLGCYRIMLLPFQIYDVHSFALDNLVSDSSEQTAASAKTKTSERLRALDRRG